jgi:hypothetical protein
MRYLRKARAEGKDTAFLEQTCAFYVAWMGHYIGDGSQPLHDTIHHDGWQGPNPNGYTRDPKVHGRFESQYVDALSLSLSLGRGYSLPHREAGSREGRRLRFGPGSS